MANNNILDNSTENPQVSRIDEEEVKYWTEKWGITEGELTKAVSAAGVETGKIEAWLRKNEIIK